MHSPCSPCWGKLFWLFGDGPEVYSYILGQLNNFKSVIKTFNPQIKRKQKSNKKNTIDKETLKKDSTQKKLTSIG